MFSIVGHSVRMLLKSGCTEPAAASNFENWRLLENTLAARVADHLVAGFVVCVKEMV